MKFLLSLLLLGGVVSPSSAQTPESPASTSAATPEQATRDWAAVLDADVDARGYVDFRALSQHPAQLQRFVDWIAVVDPTSHPQLFADSDAVLAYHINAYNALAMRQVLAFDTPVKLTPLRRLRFFKLSKVTVGGRRLSLQAYENDVIRKLGDPRVHVALNCMSESCPRLPREPFTPAQLQAQLDREAHKFFNESRNVRIDDAARTVYLTEIMDFFPEDFTAVAPSPIAYANRYRDEQKIPDDYRVRFTPYDWTIIQQR